MPLKARLTSIPVTLPTPVQLGSLGLALAANVTVESMMRCLKCLQIVAILTLRALSRFRWQALALCGYSLLRFLQSFCNVLKFSAAAECGPAFTAQIKVKSHGAAVCCSRDLTRVARVARAAVWRHGAFVRWHPIVLWDFLTSEEADLVHGIRTPLAYEHHVRA